MIKHKDGTLNIDDLLSKDKTESTPIRADIAGIELADAELTWRDEQKGSTTTVSGLELTTGRLRIDTGRQAYEAHAVALKLRGKLDGWASFRIANGVATSGGQGAKDLEYLKDVTLPVRASGPFDKLAYKIEFGELGSAAVKAKVEEKTQELKQKATEKLLKGIFGR